MPAIVDPLVARCLAKRPDDRFATMIELQQACDAVLAQLPAESATATVFDPLPPIAMPRADSTTTLGTSVGESTAGSGPRKLGMWIAVSAVAVAAGIVLAVMTTRSPARDESALVPATTVVPAPVVEEPKPEPKAEAPAIAAPHGRLLHLHLGGALPGRGAGGGSSEGEARGEREMTSEVRHAAADCNFVATRFATRSCADPRARREHVMAVAAVA